MGRTLADSSKVGEWDTDDQCTGTTYYQKYQGAVDPGFPRSCYQGGNYCQSYGKEDNEWGGVVACEGGYELLGVSFFWRKTPRQGAVSLLPYYPHTDNLS